MNLLSEIRSYKYLFLLAILIRLLVIPFFFHPDIRVYHFQSSFLQRGVFDIYTYLNNNKTTLPFKEEFVYFPLTYFFLGAYQALVLPFLGSQFTSWLNGGPTHYLFRYLFILKIPYLFADLLIAQLLYRYFDNKETKKFALITWLFNPFSIILIYIFSNIDVIPVLFSVWSLYLIKKNKGLSAGIALAIGAGFKAYPILLLPALLLTNESCLKQIKNMFWSIVLFIAILLPFWNESFIRSSFSSGLTNKFFEYGIDVGLIRRIPYFIIIYMVVFAFIYFKRKKDQWLFYLVTTLMTVVSINYHIQWLLWFTPFLVILLVNYRKYLVFTILILFTGFLIPLLLNDRYMSVSLLAPISELFNQVSFPYIFLAKYINPYRTQSILRNVLFILSLLLTVKTIAYEKSGK